MSDVLIALGAFTAALIMYALGYWTGRSSERDRAEPKPEPIPILLAWCIAAQHDKCPGRIQRDESQPMRRCRCECHALQSADPTAVKYRLAWLSARRRAHRGRLLTQLLHEGTHTVDDIVILPGPDKNPNEKPSDW